MRKITMLPSVCSAHGDRWRPKCPSCKMARQVNRRYGWRPTTRYSLGLMLFAIGLIALVEWLA